MNETVEKYEQPIINDKPSRDDILKSFFDSKRTGEKKLQAGYVVWEKDFLKLFFLTYDAILTWYEKERYRIKDEEDISLMQKLVTVEFVQFDGKDFKKKTFSLKDLKRENAPLKKK